MVASILALATAHFLPLNPEIDAIVEKHLADHHVVGASVVVMRDGKVAAETYRGFADRDGGAKVNADTRMRLASVSKSVTAAIAMREAAAGRIDLDADIRTYVPTWPDKGTPVTLRQILAHRSGIRHYAGGKNDTYFRDMPSLDFLKTLQNDDLLFKPGEKYSYSTHAYTLAAAALESATGKPFPELVAKLSATFKTPNLQCESAIPEWPNFRSRHYEVENGAAKSAGRPENLS